MASRTPPPPHVFTATPELLTTERLELRAPALEHAGPVFEAVRASLPELRAWMRWASDAYAREDAVASLRRAVASFVLRTDLRYHVFRRSDGELVGSTGLHRIDWGVPRMEIGYWIRTRDAGQGYATEAARALADLALGPLGAARVEIRCDDRNLASARVAERCGFRLEGVLRSFMLDVEGRPADMRVYARTRDAQAPGSGGARGAPER